MKRESLPAPSFALKKAPYSTAAVLSDDGKLLCQVTARVVVWDLERREVIAEHKLIKNEKSLALSPGGEVLAVKNTNGEIVFAETRTGRVISSTGPFRMNRDGGRPQFTRDGKALVDGDWNGTLRLIAVDDAREVDRREFGSGYMFDGIVAARGARRLFALQDAKDGTRNGTRIVSMGDDGDIHTTGEVAPVTREQAKGTGWTTVQQFAVDPQASRMALVLQGRSMSDPNTLEVVELGAGRSISTPIGSRMHFALGLTCSREGLVAVSVNENLPRKGMSMADHRSAHESIEHSHVHIYDAQHLDLLARWHWKGAWTVDYSPSGEALIVISTDEPGAYLAHLPMCVSGGSALRASTRSRPIAAEVSR
jgi:hypothetical protein